MPGWAVVVAVAAALVPATVLGAHRLLDSANPPASHAADHSTDLPIPPVSPSGSPSTGTPAQSPASAPPAKLPRVAPDAPRRIIAGKAVDAGFDNAVTGLDAASTSEVARWERRGSPGSPGTDAVYVVGKVLGDDSGFAGLPRVRPGTTVSIRTDSGTLTYTVSATSLVREDGLLHDPRLTEHVAGRLVLIGIRYDGSGGRLAKALVVTAQLSGAKRS